jgi:hypothetical protein
METLREQEEMEMSLQQTLVHPIATVLVERRFSAMKIVDNT